MHKLAYWTARQIQNIYRYGPGYEIHFMEKKLGIIKEQPKADWVRQQEFWQSHHDLIQREVKAQYRMVMGRNADIGCPERFTEKIQWMKLHDRNPLRSRLADKHAVKAWAAEKIGTEHIIPSYGAWESFDEIDFSRLPKQFVLKCSHGCGMNIVIKNKKILNHSKNRNKIRYLLEAWMAADYSYAGMEMHYSDIPRKIIAEKYISEIDGGLYDYKIHCFHGRPEFIQVIGERDLSKHTAKQKHYDFDWKDLGWTFADYPDFPKDVPRPGCLEELKQNAGILSAGFAYVRVDFYVIENKILFGEMTFTPAGGFYPYKDRWTEQMDIRLGRMMPDLGGGGIHKKQI